MQTDNLCLVLGANGFIGSHLVDELVAAGYSVRAFDRFAREEQFDKSPQVEVFTGDIFDEQSLKKALKNVAYVFHCFSATTPFTSDQDAFSDIDKNLRPSVSIFEQCSKANIQKVVFLSSGGAVYGQVAEQKPAGEDDAATPVSPYGIVKLAIENYLAYFNRKTDLDYIVYRLTNPYGPRQANNNQGVIPIFLNKVQNNEELVVYGDGESSRDFLYIRDATRMIVESFNHETKFKTYNIGSGSQTSLNQIIAAIEKATGTKPHIKHVESPKTFLQKAQVSMERYNQEFSARATTSLEDGIKKTIAD